MPAAAGSAAAISFALEHKGKCHETKLRPGETSYVGRGHKCFIVLDDVAVSGQHLEFSLSASGRLCVRDCSRNGTGIRIPDATGELGPQEKKVSKEKPLELVDGSLLFVPLHNPKKPQEGEAAVDARFKFKVRLRPDASALNLPAKKNPSLHPAVVDEVDKKSHLVKAESSLAPALPSGPGLDEPNLPDVYDPVTKTGRWRYEARLGEGGLGVVYRALDCSGRLGHVAIKVLKPRSVGGHKDGRFIFEMYRESQWSMWMLHNEFDARYDQQMSQLFVRYLEEHTGFGSIEPKGFEKKREHFESPIFDWETNGPPLARRPYIVMELVQGEALHLAIDRQFVGPRNSDKSDKLLSKEEKRDILLQAAKALEYLEKFGLIHRDFRGCNMHVYTPSSSSQDGTNAAGSRKLKVLDLGIMITAHDGQVRNSNEAVKAFQRRGETEEKRKRYDWLPWEIRGGCDGSAAPVNFALPSFSFDVFSLGVLMLHMLIGRTKARAFLDSVQNNPHSTINTSELGIPPSLLLQILASARERPHPTKVVKAFTPSLTVSPLDSKLSAEASQQLLATSRGLFGGAAPVVPAASVKVEEQLVAPTSGAKAIAPEAQATTAAPMQTTSTSLGFPKAAPPPAAMGPLPPIYGGLAGLPGFPAIPGLPGAPVAPPQLPVPAAAMPSTASTAGVPVAVPGSVVAAVTAAQLPGMDAFGSSEVSASAPSAAAGTAAYGRHGGGGSRSPERKRPRPLFCFQTGKDYNIVWNAIHEDWLLARPLCGRTRGHIVRFLR
eukprot:TRINITY_DN34115_c1_g1_i3.p1 TRINITY_DN34115_c1_g1~~TRINITY_DN34115_c1_g1_i3.p1  ORF type:complete len:775 (-),score=185.39 TRINITY_DN34115_c1_g1_i3:444-2768(-)